MLEKFRQPKYMRVVVALVMVAALVALFTIVEPTLAGHCPAPNIPVCP